MLGLQSAFVYTPAIMWFIYWDICGLMCCAVVRTTVTHSSAAPFSPIFSLTNAASHQQHQTITTKQSWFVIFFADYCVMRYILPPWFEWNWIGLLNGLVFQTFILGMAASWIKAACTDPGSVTQDTVRSNGGRDVGWLERTHTFIILACCQHAGQGK